MLIEFAMTAITFMFGLLMGYKTGLVTSTERKNFSIERSAFKDTIANLRKTIDGQAELIEEHEKVKTDINNLNNTTIKVNDFYSSKIAKIQDVLNEKE